MENSVAICLNGQPLTAWSAKAKPPHVHEEAGYYAAVPDLEALLGVKAEIAGDKQSVTVNGKRVESTAREAKNIHEHDGLVFAPIKEFAEAAGYAVQVDGVKHTVHIRK
ncbi:MAG: hypothetical protein ACOY94_25415 [Bacillota bacterium]